MRTVDLFISSVWVVFWIYWLVASVGVKSVRQGTRRSAGQRVGVLVVIALLFRGGFVHDHGATSNHALELIGTIVFLAGLGFAVWARRYLGSNWGAPMSQKVDPELITGGPYRYVRHPIYSGILLGMIGTAIAISWYWLVGVAVVGAYFVYSARTEERYMSDLFPEAYPAYRRKSKMLIPFIY